MLSIPEEKGDNKNDTQPIQFKHLDIPVSTAEKYYFADK
jgi:hypothetical protein